MLLNFVFATSTHLTGGVTMLFEFADAMARRGHDVHFIHGPATSTRVDRVDEVPFDFDERVTQHIVDRLDDPTLPTGDAVFHSHAPARLGAPLAIVQGFRLIGPQWDALVFRVPCPKICIASWLVDVGLAFGVPREQLVHVPMGLDHELFSVRTPWRDRPFDVAMLYHPYPEKGWAVGARALDLLTTRRPGLRAVVFSLAGPPPGELPEGVELWLGLTQDRLADEVYNASRLLVQSSRHEGFGLTAVEAMACGAALVTTDCGGSRDYAFAGTTAAVVPAGDADGLATAATELLAAPGLAVRMADAGTEFVRCFDWDHSAVVLEEFLERYVAEPAAFQLEPGEDRSEQYSL